VVNEYKKDDLAKDDDDAKWLEKLKRQQNRKHSKSERQQLEVEVEEGRDVLMCCQ